MLSHDVVLEARDRAFGDNRAAVHYAKAITDGETEIEVLFDERMLVFPSCLIFSNVTATLLTQGKTDVSSSHCRCRSQK